MAYISYFQFFTELKQIISDVTLDMGYEDLKGEAFDKTYNNIINKLVQRCKSFADSSFRGESKFVGAYIADIRATKAYPQIDRMDKLACVTDDYIKRSV